MAYVSGGGCYRGAQRMRNYQAARKREYERQLNQFADMIADDWTIKAAAEFLGLSPQMGTYMMKDLRTRLGPQAC